MQLLKLAINLTTKRCSLYVHIIVTLFYSFKDKFGESGSRICLHWTRWNQSYLCCV